VGDELELKYSIEDPDAVVAWLDERLPPAPGYDWRTVDMTDTYFDTADRALARAGYGARLRRQGRRLTVGVKSEVATASGRSATPRGGAAERERAAAAGGRDAELKVSSGALATRNELEADATADLDPNAWPPSETRDTVRQLAGREPLVRRFVLRQKRRRREYGGLELSVDDVAIRRGRTLAGRLTELEVEYKSGRRSELTRVSRMLDKSGLVKPEPRSKMALAAEMVEGPPSIYAGDPLSEAARKVLARLLDRLIERESIMRDGDTLALKQMRVATRRMRAAWRSFDGAFRARDVRRYVGELREVARRLGAVRDLDVLLENLPDQDDLKPLRDAWRDKRDSLWNDLLDELGSNGYQKFVADYRELVNTPGGAATTHGRTTRTSDAAASLVWAAYERVRAAQPPIGVAVEPDLLHALRIAARQFRYTLEAYRELLEPTAYDRLLQRLVKLQDLVGALNDADVAAREVGTWLADQADPQPAVEAYRSGLEGEVGRLSKAVAPAARGVLGVTFRRLLGRATAGI
jgi:triphosphatase